jgi:hypothetical protein
MTESSVQGMPARMVVRRIVDADEQELLDLIMHGFDTYPREFWKNVFDVLRRRSAPERFPRYGYVLEYEGRLVGVILLIYSKIWDAGIEKLRCNGSTVYVHPDYSHYAPLLYSRTNKDKDVTVLNITAQRNTRKMIEVMGFSRYNNGLFVAVPLLSRPRDDAPAHVFSAHIPPGAPFDPHERDLLLDHAGFGCTSLWCVSEGQAYPFVFRPRKIRSVLPVVQLVYCRDVDDFGRFARAIGLYFAKKGRLFVLLDANGAIPGLVGKYFAGKAPRYFRGPDQPRLGDLAYTETSLFGT